MKHSTWRITCRPVFTLTSDEQRFFCKKNRRKVGRSSMSDPDRGLRSASDIGPSPLQGAPAGNLGLPSPPTLRKSSVGRRRPNTHPRKIRYGDPV